MAYMRFGSILPITFLVLIVALLASVRAAPSSLQSRDAPAVIIGTPQEGDVFLVGTQVVCLFGLGSFRDASQLPVDINLAFVSDRSYMDLGTTSLELGDVKKIIFTIPEYPTVRNAYNIRYRFLVDDGHTLVEGYSGNFSLMI